MSNKVINATFRYFSSKVPGFALAGLAPKLRQIASIRKKAEEAQWNGLSGKRTCVPSVYWGQAQFSSLILSSDLLVLEQRIWHHRVSIVETHQLIPKFAKKNRNLTSRPIRGHKSGHVKAGHIGYHSIRGHEQTLWCQFHSSIIFGSKLWPEE